MSKQIFKMAHPISRDRAISAVRGAPVGYTVKVEPPSRSLDQNAAQWPILQAFADQIQWPVNGAFVYMTPDEWKDVLTAAFKQDTTRLAMGLNGGVVMLGQRTSKMDKKIFSEWLAFLNATAIDRGVKI